MAHLFKDGFAVPKLLQVPPGTTETGLWTLAPIYRN